MSSDKVYPSWATKSTTKTTAAATTINPTANPTFPATKAQQYGAASAHYRPQPPAPPRRRGRCLLYAAFLLFLSLILLAAVSASVLYAVYRPHRPDFSVSSLQISALNLSTPAAFAASLSVSVSIKNANSKISLSYDTVSVAASSSTVRIAAGTLPAFVQPAKKTIVSNAVLNGKGIGVADGEISALKSEIKKDNGLDLEIDMETKVRFTIGKLRTKKFRVTVSCVGIKANANSKGKFGGSTKTAGVNCAGKLPFKIWKWNFSF